MISYVYVVFSYSLMKEKLLNVLDDAAHRVIITTGGVSMGEKVSIFLAIIQHQIIPCVYLVARLCLLQYV